MFCDYLSLLNYLLHPLAQLVHREGWELLPTCTVVFSVCQGDGSSGEGGCAIGLHTSMVGLLERKVLSFQVMTSHQEHCLVSTPKVLLSFLLPVGGQGQSHPWSTLCLVACINFAMKHLCYASSWFGTSLCRYISLLPGLFLFCEKPKLVLSMCHIFND